VVAVSARALTPYLADAVPGWFQAVVTLFDGNGHEIGFCDDYRFSPDPVFHFQVPADGEYVVEIRDSIYRGREDFVYRVSIGEFPFITSAFPLGGPAGSKATVDVTGWNLPSNRITMNVGSKPGVYPVVLRSGQLESNRVLFAADTLPERVEREPNNAVKDAQAVSLPAIVNGRIDQPGDADVFSFRGRAGEAIVAEVNARRLGSPLDSVLDLTDARGQRVAHNDDCEDKGAALLTHHADAYRPRCPPKACLRLGDVQRKGGSEYAYRLRVSPPRPDFELRVSPSTIGAAGGTNAPVAVTAIRKDGFGGDISLALRDAPAGFTVSGGVIPGGQSSVRITFTPPPVATREPVSVRLEGRATINGQSVAHEAVAADDRMQAFAYHHLGCRDLRVMVSARRHARAVTPAGEPARSDSARRPRPRASLAAARVPVAREHPVRTERAARGYHTERGIRRRRHGGIHALGRRQGLPHPARQSHRARVRRTRAAGDRPGSRRAPPRAARSAAGAFVRDRAIATQVRLEPGVFRPRAAPGLKTRGSIPALPVCLRA
jgi:hypothetical protein